MSVSSNGKHIFKTKDSKKDENQENDLETGYNIQTLIIHKEDTVNEERNEIPSSQNKNHLFIEEKYDKSSRSNSNFQNYVNLMKSANDNFLKDQKNNLIDKISN